MNNQKGAMLILSSILISSMLTYILTKAYYRKRSVIVKSDPQELPKPKGPVEEKKEEPAKQEKPQEMNDVMRYAEKYKQQAASLVREQGYSSDQPGRAKIEVIDADIFKTNPDYEPVSYTFYADDILADEENNPITDYDNTVGRNTIENFNELEQDGAVYVRNHEFALDIEILRSLRTYKESLGGNANDKS